MCNPIKDRTDFESLEQLVGSKNYFVVGTLGLIAHCDKTDHDTNPKNATLTDTRVAIVHSIRRKLNSSWSMSSFFEVFGEVAALGCCQFSIFGKKTLEILGCALFLRWSSFVRSRKLLLRNCTQRSLALIAASQISFKDKIIEEGQKQSRFVFPQDFSYRLLAFRL